MRKLCICKKDIPVVTFVVHKGDDEVKVLKAKKLNNGIDENSP